MRSKFHNDEIIWRKQFGNKLKRLIHLKDMTQCEFAKESGIDETVLSKYITGSRMPSPYRIRHIAKILNCDISCLFDVDN